MYNVLDGFAKGKQGTGACEILFSIVKAILGLKSLVGRVRDMGQVITRL